MHPVAGQSATRYWAIIEELRKTLLAIRDRLAEELFNKDVAAGSVQFSLRTDGHNWRMPETMPVRL